jgi:hypothetical protein
LAPSALRQSERLGVRALHMRSNRACARGPNYCHIHRGTRHPVYGAAAPENISNTAGFPRRWRTQRIRSPLPPRNAREASTAGGLRTNRAVVPSWALAPLLNVSGARRQAYRRHCLRQLTCQVIMQVTLRRRLRRNANNLTPKSGIGPYWGRFPRSRASSEECIVADSYT